MRIPLTEWAASRYNPAPSRYVLAGWIERGEIYPAPELVGRAYYVEETARRLTADRPGLVERMRAAA